MNFMDSPASQLVSMLGLSKPKKKTGPGVANVPKVQPVEAPGLPQMPDPQANAMQRQSSGGNSSGPPPIMTMLRLLGLPM